MVLFHGAPGTAADVLVLHPPRPGDRLTSLIRLVLGPPPDGCGGPTRTGCAPPRRRAGADGGPARVGPQRADLGAAPRHRRGDPLTATDPGPGEAWLSPGGASMVEPADLDIDGPVAPQQLNSGRLWAGGVATAVVAALVVIAGCTSRGASWASRCSPPRQPAVSGAPPPRSTPRSPPRARCSPPACCMSCCSKHPAAQLLHLDHRAGRSHPGGQGHREQHPGHHGPDAADHAAERLVQGDLMTSSAVSGASTGRDVTGSSSATR